MTVSIRHRGGLEPEKAYVTGGGLWAATSIEHGEVFVSGLTRFIEKCLWLRLSPSPTEL